MGGGRGLGEPREIPGASQGGGGSGRGMGRKNIEIA